MSGGRNQAVRAWSWPPVLYPHRVARLPVSENLRSFRGGCWSAPIPVRYDDVTYSADRGYPVGGPAGGSRKPRDAAPPARRIERGAHRRSREGGGGPQPQYPEARAAAPGR